MAHVRTHINRGTVVMRILSVISGLLLIGVVGVVKAQGSGGAVSFMSEEFSEYLGTHATFSFAWGDGEVLRSDGESEALMFDGMMYEAYDGVVNALQSRPFILDKSKTSVEFDLGYRFFVEAFHKPPGTADQAVMALDLELYDVRTGEIHPRSASLLEPYSMDVPPGSGCDKTSVDRVSIEVDPEWVSSEPREVVLRVVFSISPGRLVINPNLVVSESFPDSSFNIQGGRQPLLWS